MLQDYFCPISRSSLNGSSKYVVAKNNVIFFYFWLLHQLGRQNSYLSFSVKGSFVVSIPRPFRTRRHSVGRSVDIEFCKSSDLGGFRNFWNFGCDLVQFVSENSLDIFSPLSLFLSLSFSLSLSLSRYRFLFLWVWLWCTLPHVPRYPHSTKDNQTILFTDFKVSLILRDHGSHPGANDMNIFLQLGCFISAFCS